jgi:hypothetical protein
MKAPIAWNQRNFLNIWLREVKRDGGLKFENIPNESETELNQAEVWI